MDGSTMLASSSVGPSTMRTTTTILIGASAVLSGLYVLTRVWKQETRGQPNEKENMKSSRSKTRTRKTTRNSHDDNDDDDDNDDGGPMFDFSNPKLCETVLVMAQNRAKRWISYQVTDATRLVGQVGGKSVKKRSVLTVDPDFLLKPLHMDERGIRELAFYEAIQASNKQSLVKTYCSVFGPRDAIRHSNTGNSITRTVSDWIGSSLHWKTNGQSDETSCDPSLVIHEVKLLHRLDLFTAPYYGLVEHITDGCDPQNGQTGSYGTKFCSYILKNNLTTNFARPSVIDIKMGVETFEPDAPEEKKLRERAKYPQQEEFGFRIVAMRIYAPSDVKAAEDGYIYIPKEFGRSLNSRDEVKRALVKFLGGGEQEQLSKEVLQHRSYAIKKILSELKLIRKWFHENDVFSFTASSLLIIYESDAEAPNPDGASVKMIDFGRVRRRKGGDLGYRHGLRTLMSMFEDILRDDFWSEDYAYVE